MIALVLGAVVVAAVASLTGHSVQGHPIRVVERDGAAAGRTVLVVGCIHGNEPAGIAVTKLLVRGPRPAAGRLVVIEDLNPDGRRAHTRVNAHGVDLNRNFPAEWHPIGRRGDLEYAGPRPLSEPETRFARAVVRRYRPDVSIWFHQPQDVVRAWGPSVSAARGYARAAHWPFRAIRWPSGTAANWQNHAYPSSASFVVELAPGPLPAAAARRHAAAVRAMLR
jgi:murein peptide amidase A